MLRSMGSLSRNKGKRVEREAANRLTAIGIPSERSAQHCGKCAADLRTDLEGVHFEVKARKAHAALRFYEQAEEDAKGAIPVVLLREDGDPRFFVLVDLAHVRDLSVRICRIGEIP
jgi:Holliday junction resolvase